MEQCSREKYVMPIVRHEYEMEKKKGLNIAEEKEEIKNE